MPKNTVSTHRALGTPQLAFARAWAEGIDPVVAWERFLFLEGAGDPRQARKELARILDELKRVARLHGRADYAALLSRDPEAMVEKARVRPSLDQFRQGYDDDFFTEAELLALYEETHGRPDSRSSARRRQRLRERLVLAIQWLQEKASRPPAPDDATTLWMDQRVAARLAVVGIHRLSELLFWVRSQGFHWHRKIPQLGPQGATRIVRWLREHQASLGPLPELVQPGLARLQARSAALLVQTAIVPIERFAVPEDERSGAFGSNRGPQQRCKIQAAHDVQAIQAWLALRPSGGHTWRAYRKEAERFLLWAVLDRRKAVSSLDGADCAAYRDFLRSPGPAWLGPRNTQRWSEAWRPFEGALSARSQATALAIVRALCAWLHRQRYLDANPWHNLPALADGPAQSLIPALSPAQTPATAHSLRALTREDWALLQAWLGGLPPSPATARLSFLLNFAFFSGLRLSELAEARLSWFVATADKGEGVGEAPGMAIRVPGPLGALGAAGPLQGGRVVALSAAAMDVLASYLRARSLNPKPTDNPPDTPLLCHLREPLPLGSARVYAILVDAFRRCASSLDQSGEGSAERLRQASTGWLRHSFAADAAVRGGVPHVLLQRQ